MNASFRLERAATRASHVSAEEIGAISVYYIFIIGLSSGFLLSMSSRTVSNENGRLEKDYLAIITSVDFITAST